MSDSTPGSVLLLVSLFAIAAPASAQSDTERRDPRTTVTNAGALVPFLEGTDVFFALRQDTVFEADIQPHLVAYQNFTDLIDITQQTKRQKTFAISITGTPAVRLRMFDQVWQAGDIITAEPGEATAFEALTDAVTVVVKTPSVPSDKYLS